MIPTDSAGVRCAIVLIEADGQLRELLARELRAANCFVWEAADGTSGVEMVRSLEPPPDLVIAGTTPSAPDHEEVIRRILAHRPTQRILRLVTRGAPGLLTPEAGDRPAIHEATRLDDVLAEVRAVLHD